MRILETERLLLKSVERDDLKFLLDLRWDAAVMKGLIHDPISVRSQEDWFEKIQRSNDVALSIFIKENGELTEMTIVGTVGLYNFKHRHQIATWRVRLAPGYQGMGIAREAIMLVLDYGFNTLNLNKIISDSFADNEAIVSLSKKLGFVEEGILRSHYFHDGKFKGCHYVRATEG